MPDLWHLWHLCNPDLDVPPYADDGGEKAEIAGIYLIDSNGQPHRIGMAIGNEFSDNQFEKKNYLNLAGSKIRTCSLGAELVIDPSFDSVPGKVSIHRDGQEIWTKEILTGENEMCHSLRNIEQHHFKFETHRRPGDLHVHSYGACALSFGDGIKLADEDVMKISFAGFGRALRNPLRIATGQAPSIHIQPLKANPTSRFSALASWDRAWPANFSPRDSLYPFLTAPRKKRLPSARKALISRTARTKRRRMSRSSSAWSQMTTRRAPCGSVKRALYPPLWPARSASSTARSRWIG